MRNDSYTATGFTLVELMVALALSLFLIGGVLLLYLSGRISTIESDQLSRMQENIRFASDYIVRDIRNAGFRDENGFLEDDGTLVPGISVAEFIAIGQNYAEITENGTVLNIRYAGRGTCAERLDGAFRLVENQYFLNEGTSELSCRGMSELGERTVGLVSGLSGVSFEYICPPGVASCSCDKSDDDACIGVRIGLQFQGLQDPDNPGNFANRAVELTAAFRNTVLDRVYR